MFGVLRAFLVGSTSLAMNGPTASTSTSTTSPTHTIDSWNNLLNQHICLALEKHNRFLYHYDEELGLPDWFLDTSTRTSNGSCQLQLGDRAAYEIQFFGSDANTHTDNMGNFLWGWANPSAPPDLVVTKLRDHIEEYLGTTTETTTSADGTDTAPAPHPCASIFRSNQEIPHLNPTLTGLTIAWVSAALLGPDVKAVFMAPNGQPQSNGAASGNSGVFYLLITDPSCPSIESHNQQRSKTERLTTEFRKMVPGGLKFMPNQTMAFLAYAETIGLDAAVETSPDGHGAAVVTLRDPDTGGTVVARFDRAKDRILQLGEETLDTETAPPPPDPSRTKCQQLTFGFSDMIMTTDRNHKELFREYAQSLGLRVTEFPKDEAVEALDEETTEVVIAKFDPQNGDRLNGMQNVFKNPQQQPQTAQDPYAVFNDGSKDKCERFASGVVAAQMDPALGMTGREAAYSFAERLGLEIKEKFDNNTVVFLDRVKNEAYALGFDSTGTARYMSPLKGDDVDTLNGVERLSLLTIELGNMIINSEQKGEHREHLVSFCELVGLATSQREDGNLVVVDKGRTDVSVLLRFGPQGIIESMEPLSSSPAPDGEDPVPASSAAGDEKDEISSADRYAKFNDESLPRCLRFTSAMTGAQTDADLGMTGKQAAYSFAEKLGLDVREKFDGNTAIFVDKAENDACILGFDSSGILRYMSPLGGDDVDTMNGVDRIGLLAIALGDIGINPDLADQHRERMETFCDLVGLSTREQEDGSVVVVDEGRSGDSVLVRFKEHGTLESMKPL